MTENRSLDTINFLLNIYHVFYVFPYYKYCVLISAEHIYKHASVDKKKLTMECSQCGSTFVSKYSLNRHNVRYHPSMGKDDRTRNLDITGIWCIEKWLQTVKEGKIFKTISDDKDRLISQGFTNEEADVLSWYKNRHIIPSDIDKKG